jgi:uncharacterized membrane protein
MDLDLRVGRCERRIAELERELARLRGASVVARAVEPQAPEVPAVALVVAAPPAAAGDDASSAPLPSFAPPPLPSAALAPVATRRAPRAEPPPRRTLEDLERVMGVAVLGRIGVAALLLAAGYFAQLAYRHVGPTARVLSIYGLSALLVAGGFWSRARVAPAYVAILWGGGVAAAYLAGVVARLSYGLVSWPVALALLAAACAMGQALAAASRTRALGVVAIVGAFAAPALAGVTGDPRTVLLVYLLSLHAWATALEWRRGWEGLRILGVVGTVAVAAGWASRHAGVDASTYVHVHLYVAGLLLPEALAAWRGKPLSIAGGLAVAVAWAAEAVLLVPALDRHVVTGYALLAGLALAGGAGILSLRRRPLDGFGRHLARLGLVLGVVGAALVWAPYSSDRVSEAQVLVSVAAAAVLAVALCRRFATGEGAAALASLVSTAWCLASDRPTPLTAVALVPAAALVLGARRAPFRIAGLVLAVLATFAGLVPPRTGDAGEWLAAAFLGAAALAAAVRALSRHRADLATARAVEPVLALVAVAWAAVSFRGALAPVGVPFGNPGTIAAIALAGAAALARPWQAGAGGGEPYRIASAATLVGVVALALWRELDALAVDALSLAGRGLARTALLAGLAAAVAAVGRRTRSEALAVVATLGFAAAAVFAFHAAPPADPLFYAGHVAVLAAAGAVAAVLLPVPMRGAVAPGLLSAAVLWLDLLFGHAPAASVALGNVRFLSALLVAAALAFAAGRAAPRSAAAVGGRVAAVVLLYLAGLAEVRDAVAPMALAWQRAWTSVYSTVAAAAVLATGFRTRLPELRWTALAGFAAVIAKVGLLDLSMLDTPYRILVTAVLGGVLLLAAYGYARRGARPGTRDVRVTQTPENGGGSKREGHA